MPLSIRPAFVKKGNNMKACIVQPPYSDNYSESDKYFAWEMQALDKCDESMDLIVFPESCDVPCFASSNEEHFASVEKYNKVFLDKAAQTAKRCGAVIFVNGKFKCNNGYRNTTYAFNREGKIAGYYFKQHLTPREEFKLKLENSYALEPFEPDIIEIDGIRYAFLTCYDFYFYEYFSQIARYKPDIIIGCSHQRTDTHGALEVICRFLAYNCNAYLVRSSVSIDENSKIGGASMIVAPDSKILLNMKSRSGMACAEFNPKDKYYKPAGYKNPPSSHFEYTELGRKPWKYRPAGASVVLPDSLMEYPRVCAHRGFSASAPENSLPAYGAAVALGAEEIEFDLWLTKDGEFVSAHDNTLERVSTGTGDIREHTYEELLKYDFGIKFNEKFKGLRILRFEEILKKFACRCIMNIHIKMNKLEDNEMMKIIDLIDKYDCRKYVYFMSGKDNILEQAGRLAPDIARCVGAGGRPYELVERALKYGCKKIQLFKPEFTREMIDKAHENGIRCNVFWSDDPKETVEFLDMGIDTILSNDYFQIANVVKEWKIIHERK